jgi:hypothetical protein
MDDKDFEDTLRDDVQKQINFQIYKCMKHWGIEGCLEKIETLYSTMPELKELWLIEYWKIVRGK